ncbi:Fc.00g003910.m01.CDS01 [Cosmosporella sp. VM-42]
MDVNLAADAPIPSNPDENGGPAILAATLLITALATITVVARIYVRGFVIRNPGYDDGFMIFAMALAWAGQGVIVAQVSHGAGRHLGDVDPLVYQTGMKLNFVSQPIFLIAICVVKLAVGSSLLRIASTKFYKYLIVSIMGFMAFYTIGCFFTLIFQCTDIRILWDSSVKATCWSKNTLQGLSYTNAALNILTDLLFAIVIPTPMLWNLNVHFRTRVSLIGILGLGVFACAAAFVKLGYVTNYGKLGDWLWDSQNITIWTAVELNVGIMAGSLPCLRPIFRTFLGSYYGKGSRKTPTTAGTGTNYGHGTLRSAKNWQSLSSGRRGADDVADETSSQKAINTGMDAYELRDRIAAPGGITNKTTILTELDANSSDDSVDRIAMGTGYGGRPGIKKTTVTTVEVSQQRR